MNKLLVTIAVFVAASVFAVGEGPIESFDTSGFLQLFEPEYVEAADPSLPVYLSTDDGGETWNLLLTGIELFPAEDVLWWEAGEMSGEIVYELVGSEIAITMTGISFTIPVRQEGRTAAANMLRLKKKCRCQDKAGNADCSTNTDCDTAEDCGAAGKHCKWFLDNLRR